MKDLSTLAKLLAEEDIHVIHRKQSTAMFDVKNRTLSLPIWKEMSKDIQDLMTIHEVGHALWTPLEQLERAIDENIEFSFVNVLEDVRIEKLAQKKYPGSVKVFRRGYRELIQSNFFETLNRDISEINLIDRINLHYKHHVGVPFSSEEQVWVEKANNTVTPDDVLELAKELYEYMVQNQKESDFGHDDDRSLQSENMLSPEDISGMPSNTPMPSNKGEELEENSDNGNTTDSKSENEGSTPSSPASSEESGEESNDVGSASSSEKSDEESDDSSSKESTGESQADGGESSGTPITASTDKASSNNTKNMLDGNASDRQYAFTPKVNTKEVIVSYKTILEIWNTSITKQKERDNRWFNYTASELETTKKSSKKIVQYLVKEFEMKKAADLYARSSSSKTGSLDMSKLHTYKYNDDLFAKITTLPGATNHGLVLFLDWSGSMAHNLQGTLNQLYNIIWFCNQVKIPFEVFAFSNSYGTPNSLGAHVDNFSKITTPKSGEYKLRVNLLQFFSSKMNKNEIQTMMHNLNMYASRWGGYKDWREVGYPYSEPRGFGLGSTPLNDAIICAMDILPKYKKSTGVQKLHTVFLTDGAGDSMSDVHHVHETENGDVMGEGRMSSYFSGTTIITDSVTGKTVETNKKDLWKGQTGMLLELLRKRVPDMNIVNFFVAGSGRNGTIKKGDLYSYFGYSEIPAKIQELKKNNVLVIEKGQGFDQLYLLPGLGGVSTDTDELDVEVGASKAQLKRAFGKMTSGKLTSRPVLNNFIKMVA